MAPDEFVRLVWAMRDAQKQYFLVRTQDALRRAQNLEREVDAEILRVANGVDQPKLFSES